MIEREWRVIAIVERVPEPPLRRVVKILAAIAIGACLSALIQGVAR